MCIRDRGILTDPGPFVPTCVLKKFAIFGAILIAPVLRAFNPKNARGPAYPGLPPSAAG